MNGSTEPRVGADTPANDGAGRPSPALVPLLSELNVLKRVGSAGRDGTVATRLFRHAWGELTGGRPAPVVATEVTMRAVAAARLGDLDRALLASAGLSRAQITRTMLQAIDEGAGALDGALLQELRDAVVNERARPPGESPAFVSWLEQQPRASLAGTGAVRPGGEPAENHADHCLVVAVYGVLLAPVFGAAPATVFQAALAHHFHNAGMPDAGPVGERLLGAHLERVKAHFTTACLDELEQPLRDHVVNARKILPDADTPEGRAFHAADAVDESLQARAVAGRAAGTVVDREPGPASFRHRVLADLGLS